jgi:diamine N-acetyltransferase
MFIRKAGKDDVEVLQKLNKELFADNSKYDPDLNLDWAESVSDKKYFTKVLNNPNAMCLIAEEKGKPVGYLTAAPKEMDWRMSKYLEIESMVVIPQHRSKGVGTLLLEKCLEMAKAKGYQKVYVTSYFDNIKAIEFYKRNGFKPIDLSLEMEI